MREAELIEALGKGKGGIQINVSKSGIMVTVKYVPYTKIRVKTNLMDALLKVAERVYNWHKVIMPYHNRDEKLFQALVDYNNHSSMLQI